MFNFSLVRILGISLAFIVYSGILGFYSYQKGTLNERNSLENQQKAAIIANQKKVIDQQIQSIAISNNIVESQQIKLESQQVFYNNSEKKLQDETVKLNNANRITRHWVRLANASISHRTMPKFSKSASSINAKASTVAASTVLNTIVNNNEQCNKYIIQLSTLIDWMTAQQNLALTNKRNK